jgi:hypothetical protein
VVFDFDLNEPAPEAAVEEQVQYPAAVEERDE